MYPPPRSPACVPTRLLAPHPERWQEARLPAGRSPAPGSPLPLPLSPAIFPRSRSSPADRHPWGQPAPGSPSTALLDIQLHSPCSALPEFTDSICVPPAPPSNTLEPAPALLPPAVGAQAVVGCLVCTRTPGSGGLRGGGTRQDVCSRGHSCQKRTSQVRLGVEASPRQQLGHACPGPASHARPHHQGAGQGGRSVPGA